MAVLNDAAARWYLRWWASALVALTLGVLAFTVLIDPYYVFGTPRHAGLNLMKPKAGSQGVLAKTHQLPRICARTLLLGNSRVEVGLDPESPAWPAALRPVFNAGIAGTGPDIALRLLHVAQRTCPPRLVVVAADFPDALTTALPLPSQGAKRAPGPGERLAALATATLTVDAVSDSLLTLVGQLDPYSVDMTPDGLNPLREYMRIAARQGYYRLFAQKLDDYAAHLRTAPWPVLDPAHNASLWTLQRVVEEARAGGSDVVILIHPYHESYLDLLRRFERGETFLEWKHALAGLADRFADPEQGNQVRLADFSTIEATHEPIPPPGDVHAEMRFYWESGHYKSALGDLVIGRMFADADSPR